MYIMLIETAPYTYFTTAELCSQLSLLFFFSLKPHIFLCCLSLLRTYLKVASREVAHSATVNKINKKITKANKTTTPVFKVNSAEHTVCEPGRASLLSKGLITRNRLKAPQCRTTRRPSGWWIASIWSKGRTVPRCRLGQYWEISSLLMDRYQTENVGNAVSKGLLYNICLVR